MHAHQILASLVVAAQPRSGVYMQMVWWLEGAKYLAVTLGVFILYRVGGLLLFQSQQRWADLDNPTTKQPSEEEAVVGTMLLLVSGICEYR